MHPRLARSKGLFIGLFHHPFCLMKGTVSRFLEPAQPYYCGGTDLSRLSLFGSFHCIVNKLAGGEIFLVVWVDG